MKYFVTGATGFIGGRVARQLIAAGHQVIALARTPAKAQDLTDLGVVVHQGDVTDKASMRAPMTGVDGVFHIAAWYQIGARDKSQAEKINVEGTRNVFELMQELGIPKGVYTSTLAVFSNTHGQMVDETYRDNGPWLSEYNRTKWKAHYEIAEPMMKAGLPLVIVQPGLVYGPGDMSLVHETFVEFVQRRLLVAPQKSVFCWAHVDDVARGHIEAMEKGRIGESYIIAGERCSFIDAMKLASKVTGIPAPPIQPPPWVMHLLVALIKPVEA
jgi:nucleoside-diphosphate-sugar epimerase